MAKSQQQDDVRRLRTAALWANALARTFKRVALFEIKGTDARVVYLKGLDLSCRGERLSLLSQNPLRWSIEAASPIVGSGRSPGVDQIQEALHIERPRAFTVMPIVIDGKIRAFTYADNDHEPFSLEAVSQLFETCQNAVEHKDPSAVFEQPKRSRRKSSSHFGDLTERQHKTYPHSSSVQSTSPNPTYKVDAVVEGPLSTPETVQMLLQFKKSHLICRRATNFISSHLTGSCLSKNSSACKDQESILKASVDIGVGCCGNRLNRAPLVRPRRGTKQRPTCRDYTWFYGKRDWRKPGGTRACSKW